MKQSFWILVSVVLVLALGSLYYIDHRRDAQHEVNDHRHVHNAFANVQLAEQNASRILGKWNQASPLEISDALLEMSNELNTANVETQYLQDGLADRDRSGHGGKIDEISYLLLFYQQTVNTSLKTSWQLRSGDDTQKESLHQDIETFQTDLHHLGAFDQSKFETNDVAVLLKEWVDWTHDLKCKEVLDRYRSYFGLTS
jgi:hypothetical protein